MTCLTLLLRQTEPAEFVERMSVNSGVCLFVFERQRLCVCLFILVLVRQNIYTDINPVLPGRISVDIGDYLLLLVL